METINTKERIEVISLGKTDKKGRLYLGAEGAKIKCHPKQAEQYVDRGWIKPFKLVAKTEEKTGK